MHFLACLVRFVFTLVDFFFIILAGNIRRLSPEKRAFLPDDFVTDAF